MSFLPGLATFWGLFHFLGLISFVFEAVGRGERSDTACHQGPAHTVEGAVADLLSCPVEGLCAARKTKPAVDVFFSLPLMGRRVLSEAASLPPAPRQASVSGTLEEALWSP